MFQGEGVRCSRPSVEQQKECRETHTNILVIGEKTARKGIGELLDVISRLYEFRNDFFLLIVSQFNRSD